MQRHSTWLVVLASFVAFSAGCGSKNPASPSSETATINGAIVSSAQGSTNGVSGAGGGGAGIVVSVNGTDLSSTINSQGRFELHGVPPGNVELSFKGPSFNASLGVPDVQASETISLNLSLGSSEVVVESQARTTGSQEQLEGRVEALPPETSTGRLVVAGRTIVTDSNTVFTLNGAAASFASLVVGQRVHVKGQTSGANLLASSIAIQNTNTDLQIPIDGIVTNFTGSQAAFQFHIEGDTRLIKGDALTEFFGGSSFANLHDGARVEVKGEQRNGFVYAVRIHVNGTGDDGGQDESASIEGVLTSIGAGATPVLIVGGTTVRTTSSTEVRRGGDVQELTVLQLGMTLHVVGDRQPDASIVARMLQIKGDAVGGLFEIEGSMGGVKGTCPTLSFGVNGFEIVTDGSTSFTPACSEFKSGNQVKVNGVVQAGGTVRATSVRKQ